MVLMCYQPADSAVGCSEIILMAARNIRVFDGRIHVSVEMTELLVPNNLENIVMSNKRRVTIYVKQSNIVFIMYTL